MIDHEHLREYVIRPVLKSLGLYSPAAEELLVFTAAAETLGGRYLRQFDNGPARGIYQMEPGTHQLVRQWANTHRRDLAYIVLMWSITQNFPPTHDEMQGNLYYATAMARLNYLSFTEPLPNPQDPAAMAAYWKKYWNTEKGAGNPTKALDQYNKYLAGEL